MSKQRTMDGRPISAGISGFSQYTTERTPAPSHPAPILTPEDILRHIRYLKELFSNERVNQALSVLFQHVNDFENPHHTDLDQFTMTIVDVLYQEYVAQGGTGSKDIYIQSLFRVLRVASLEEMKTSTDPTLLVSIRGAAAFIREHEKDPNAHKEMFDGILPGEPVSDDPCYSLHGMIGASEDIVITEDMEDDSPSTVHYTFVDMDRHITEYTGSGCLPVDWAYGQPLIACFGRRTNAIAESTKFAVYDHQAVSTIERADKAPDRSTSATAVFAGESDTELRHSLKYTVELEANKSKTFSIHARAESCRYLAITFTDMLMEAETRAIFDLGTGTFVLMNHYNRYSADIYELADGWYRCSFTMHHEYGRRDDIGITFFKEKSDMRDDTAFNFRASSTELLALIWGAQLEDGRNMSPYIPTNGQPVTREPYKLEVEMDTIWEHAEGHTVNVCYRAPGRVLGDTRHPVFTLATEDDLSVCDVNIVPEGIDVMRYEILEAGDNKIAVAQAAARVQCDHTKKYQNVTYCINDTLHYVTKNDTAPAEIATVSPIVPGKKLLIGHNPDGEYLDGYIRSVLCYTRILKDEEVVFVHGEEIDG